MRTSSRKAEDISEIRTEINRLSFFFCFFLKIMIDMANKCDYNKHTIFYQKGKVCHNEKAVVYFVSRSAYAQRMYGCGLCGR